MPNYPNIATYSNSEFSAISSSAVREIFNNNGDVSKFVPPPVANFLIHK